MDIVTEDELSPAWTLGWEAGKAAASWVFDGDTTRETYETVLHGVAAGDPMVLDMYHVPDLSGEFADGVTPAMLAHVLDIPENSDALRIACDDWEFGAMDGFWGELQRAARYQLDPLDY